jgi:hypothetical protein
VVLSFCATDFDNPLCREFALMCVRNLCEGNASNQRFISELRPQEVLQDESLAKQGITVEIDPLSGKFQFKQQLPPQEEQQQRGNGTQECCHNQHNHDHEHKLAHDVTINESDTKGGGKSSETNGGSRQRSVDDAL